MKVSAINERNSFSAQLRKYVWPSIIVAALTCAIIFGVHSIIDWAILETTKSHAEKVALDWADEFNESLPDDGTVIRNGKLSADQLSVIESAIRYGKVYSVNVYNQHGSPVYSHDYGVLDAKEEYPANQTALDVINTNSSIVTTLERSDSPGGQSLFVDAFVPIRMPDGRAIGAIQLFSDKSESVAFYERYLGWMGLLLPVLSAALYIVPSFAFIMKREQVFARTERVQQLSRFDALTGALNRHTMSSEAKARFATRAESKLIGVFFMDVDKFKTVNDAHGHEFGDAYLKHIASILMENVRDQDLVGRMGGDEFVIAFPDASLEILEEIGTVILEEARQPFEYKNTTIQGSISIGAHLAGVDESGPEALHAADLALYHAKSNGRNKMQMYFPELDTAMARRCEVEARIRTALENDEFDVKYQPLSNPKDGSIVGFEALLRLDCTEGHPISPTEFIPISEETGLIERIGLTTLRRAIETAKTWPEHVFLSVNLSPAQFKRGNLVAEIEKILADLSFPPSRLELEVTESLLMADEERVSTQLVGLKSLGISIAMDDFGTGYSSLGYLWKYDFDKLKIDRVFLEGFEFDSSRYREIIETIVILGHKLGMQVTIEGVENERQTEMLQEFACDQYQGFLFGKPMSADQACELAASQSMGKNAPAA